MNKMCKMEQQNVEFSGQNNKIHKLWVSNGVFLLIPGSYDIEIGSFFPADFQKN